MLPKEPALVIVSVPVIAVDATETGSETCFAICTGTGTDVRLSEAVLLVEKRDFSIVLDGSFSNYHYPKVAQVVEVDSSLPGA
jgi:hypothetical protein